MTIMFLVLCYMKRRLKEFNLLLERIEDGKYNPDDIPEGFDIHEIIEEQPKHERKVASMVNNPVDHLKRKNYFSSKKSLNQSTERPLDTECRTVLQTEQEEPPSKGDAQFSQNIAGGPNTTVNQ